ncbi:protein of unknown function [Xenorhabdus poinarii G6]|uniref:Uncharacterized protein n=1 Tax=Xenorhabdus poinarii G6 TaxID=1354304 RepID=A0A068R478_9GAMM|nr:protein of unknown function [Xenorhabdus poinarii G6]
MTDVVCQPRSLSLINAVYKGQMIYRRAQLS